MKKRVSIVRLCEIFGCLCGGICEIFGCLCGGLCEIFGCLCGGLCEILGVYSADYVKIELF